MDGVVRISTGSTKAGFRQVTGTWRVPRLPQAALIVIAVETADGAWDEMITVFADGYPVYWMARDPGYMHGTILEPDQFAVLLEALGDGGSMTRFYELAGLIAAEAGWHEDDRNGMSYSPLAGEVAPVVTAGSVDDLDLTCKCGPDHDDCAADCQCACHDGDLENTGEKARAGEVNSFSEDQVRCILTQVLGKNAEITGLLITSAKAGNLSTLVNGIETLELFRQPGSGLYSIRIAGWEPGWEPS